MQTLQICPHPTVKTKWTHNKLIRLIKDMASPKFNFDDNKQLIREACLINLWFFLRQVASYSGPYSELTDHLHIDMCNIRQDMLKPGYRGACFIPRSMYKSTIFTHGAGAWEILRNPNIRIGIVSAKVELSEMFLQSIQRVFDSNELIRFLFPEFCPELNEKGDIKRDSTLWTKQQAISPARTRSLPEPTLKALGAGGNTQGNHFDLLLADDLVGEAQLDSGHLVSAEMVKIGNWFDSNSETLLMSPKESRVVLSATRYAVEDAYSFIFNDLAEKIGYWEGMPYKIKEGSVEDPPGQWHVYYRQAIEYDKPIFPEKVDESFLLRIRERNPWMYFTQYLNNPFAASANEFSDYEIKKCELDYTDREGYIIIHFRAGAWVKQPISNAELIIGVDPAASEKQMSNKTSRSSIIVQVRTSDDSLYYIDIKAGYLSPTELMDGLFSMYNRYKDDVECTAVEMGGPFKMLKGFLDEEQHRRGTYIGLRQVRPLPDKDAKLRNFIQPLLARGAIYATDKVRKYIEEELQVFPGGTRKDVLDSMEIAYRVSVKPDSSEELDAYDRTVDKERQNCNPVTGY